MHCYGDEAYFPWFGLGLYLLFFLIHGTYLWGKQMFLQTSL